jgi:hypothetical protein
MLVDLENNVKAISDSIQEIRIHAHSDGFNNFETQSNWLTYIYRAILAI